MKWIIQLHRFLSGLSLLTLTAVFSGMNLPHFLVYTVLASTLAFYAGELLILSIVAVANFDKVDIIYPLIMFITTVIGLKALSTGSLTAVAIPVLVMFVFGYIAGGGGGDEGSRVHQGEQSGGEA